MQSETQLWAPAGPSPPGFRVLGPFEILGTEQPTGGPPQAEAELLAVLLMEAGREVSAATLLDALWGTELPADPMNALQQRISKLRRALVRLGSAARVERRRIGYLLQVDPATVDAHRFTRLVGEARSLAGRAPAAAERRYVEALSLWHGPALADFADRLWVAPYVSRFEELRMAALEEQIELALQAGRHADLVSELESLVRVHPHRERLHGQLMRALYQSGRQTESLAVYRRLRSRLANELGLEPSEELQALEQSVLRHDPALAPSKRSPATTEASTSSGAPPLLGRVQLVVQASDLLGEYRLLTLTGPGGVGKTAVALELASRLEGADGVFLVRLAGVAESGKVARAVAEAVGVEHSGDVEASLCRRLESRAALLVLDNCEHLVDACAALAARVLASCPDVRILATSREPLGVRGEVALPVPPLEVPPIDAAAGDLRAYPAVRLFVERARTARLDFEDDPATLTQVARICRALDGIPLAVELAAALTRSLPVSEIAARLDHRLRLLIGGPRTADARQQTLMGAMDWSHRLLTEPEQRLLRRLAVFRSGFSAADAERVCPGSGVSKGEVVGLLVRLVDRSLVVPDPAGGGMFRMLETIRMYAWERLVEAGEDVELGRAHAAHLLAIAEAAEPELRGPGQRRWLHWWRRERDDLAAAVRWCLAHGDTDADLGLRLVAALGWFASFAAYPEGAGDIERMLEAARDPSPMATALALQAYSLAARPRACVVHPSPVSAAAAEQSLTLFTQLDERHRAAYSQTFLAVEGIGKPDPKPSRSLLDTAAAEFRSTDDRWGLALVEFVAMDLQHGMGNWSRAAAHAERALNYFGQLDDEWGLSAVQIHQARALHRAGQLNEAAKVFESALEWARRVGVANTSQNVLAHLGHVRLQLGDRASAVRYFTDAHSTARNLGQTGSELASLGEALLARLDGDLPGARNQYLAALDLVETRPEPGLQAAAHNGLGSLASLTGDFDEAERHYRTAWELASTHDAYEIVVGAAAAASLEGLAGLAAARGEGVAAARLLGAAARWRTEHRWPPTASEQADIERAAAEARTAAGAAYDHAYHAAQQDPDSAYPGGRRHARLGGPPTSLPA
jgi:predicted ATPase/DNA-binding SARP family transcriptional activator